jgi:hypothetical protein
VSNNVNRNFEFCLSDSSAILYKEENEVYKEYLDNAIKRSFFYIFQKENPSTDHGSSVKAFIDKYHLNYLVLTKDYKLDDQLLPKIKYQVTDPGTGERFLILNP